MPRPSTPSAPLSVRRSTLSNALRSIVSRTQPCPISNYQMKLRRPCRMQFLFSDPSSNSPSRVRRNLRLISKSATMSFAHRLSVWSSFSPSWRSQSLASFTRKSSFGLSRIICAMVSSATVCRMNEKFSLSLSPSSSAYSRTSASISRTSSKFSLRLSSCNSWTRATPRTTTSSSSCNASARSVKTR